MVYVVFDLDETLAHLNTVFYFLTTLRPEQSFDSDIVNKYSYKFNETKEIRDELYKLFIKKITEKESSEQPLGLLRPGILQIMSMLYTLQKKKIIKGVVIYSNNGHLSNLEFVRDIIHNYLGTSKLICDCIYWGTSGREKEYINTSKPVPGSARKTFAVLKELLVNGPCKASIDLQPDEIYFFDDQPHYIDEDLPLGHSVKVKEYNYKAPFDAIAEIFKECLIKKEVYGDILLENNLYFINGYTCKITKTNSNTCTEKYLKYLKSQQKGNGILGSIPPNPDKSIQDIQDIIIKIEKNRKNYNSTYQTPLAPHGGRRKTRKNKKLKKK